MVGKEKLFISMIIILITPLLAGVYGILHDQLTYTISPEYYTKFKFIQFGLSEKGDALPYSERLGAVKVGFLATWWTGIPIGLVLGSTAMIYKNKKFMLKNFWISILIILLASVIAGFAGLIYGKYFLTGSDLRWFIPDNLADRENFIAVGSMHNFGYLGGFLGLMIGMAYQLFFRLKRKNNEQ